MPRAQPAINIQPLSDSHIGLVAACHTQIPDDTQGPILPSQSTIPFGFRAACALVTIDFQRSRHAHAR